MKRAFIIVTILIIMLLSVVPFVSRVNASLSSGTLADAMNTIINAANWNPSASASDLNVYNIPHFAEVFGKGDPSYYQTAASIEASSQYPYQVLNVARLAEIDGLPSAVSQSTITSYTSSASWVGSLPITYLGAYYLIYHRFMAYAWNHGLWNNAQQALAQISAIVTSGGASSPHTYIAYNANSGYATYYRYYDDTAETIEWFLQVGGTSYLSTCDLIWNFQQNYFWNGQYYGYNGQTGMETEVGPFALISGRYLQTAGTFATYSPRIVSDLNQKLVINGYSSPLWNHYSLNHIPEYDERRLENAADAWAALQAYFPVMTSTMQNTLQTQMLGVGWKGLLDQSGDFYPAVNMFGWRNDGSYSASADGPGLMYMFLNGIVPQSGSVAIPLNEESYQDCVNWSPATMFRFDYANHQIRIPVNAGTINFKFGTGTASFNFGSTGVYQIQFSNDWNTVLSTNRLGALDSQFKYVTGGGGSPTGSITAHATLNGASVAGVVIAAGGLQATTGSGGSATISNVPYGTYTVTATLSGYAQQSKIGITVSSSSPNPDIGTFTFTSSSSTGSISVDATDSAGNLIRNTPCSITVSSVGTQNAPYTFTNVAYGTYTVSATWKGEPQSSSVTVSSSNSAPSVMLHFLNNLDSGSSPPPFVIPTWAIPIVGVSAGGIIAAGIFGSRRGRGPPSKPKRKHRR